MTVKEIRERLKHIAGLCYGLSADLQYLEIENARLKNENDGMIMNVYMHVMDEFKRREAAKFTLFPKF